MRKYDFIFSLGAACSCTQMLRKAQLQIASYPFDWLFGAGLEKRVDIVLSHFERFLDIKDLSYVFSTRSISCDAYHNALFAPDPHVLRKILKKYRLNLPLLFRLKRLFLRVSIRLIPIKSVRKNLRYKYKF